jgi:hypothetical protein
MGATLPGWAEWMLTDGKSVDVPAMFGQTADEVLARWVKLDEFLLERAGEARQLMGLVG